MLPTPTPSYFSRLLVVLLLLPLAAWQQGPAYRTYRNDRFGYTIDYPSALVRPQPEADNGDGRRFTSSDGRLTLTAFAAYNAAEQSLRQKLQASREAWLKKGAVVTLAQTASGGTVVSGTLKSSLFYERTVLRNGAFTTFVWEYPADQKQLLDPIVVYTARTLIPAE